MIFFDTFHDLFSKKPEAMLTSDSMVVTPLKLLHASNELLSAKFEVMENKNRT